VRHRHARGLVLISICALPPRHNPCTPSPLARLVGDKHGMESLGEVAIQKSLAILVNIVGTLTASSGAKPTNNRYNNL
jgi:hypothetical protein